MKSSYMSALALAVAMLATTSVSHAFVATNAADAANAARCTDLGKNLESMFQNKLRALAPKSGPTTHVDDVFKADQILKTVIGGGSLSGFNIMGYLQGVATQFLQNAGANAAGKFTNGVNSVLNDYGVAGIAGGAVGNAANSATQGIFQKIMSPFTSGSTTSDNSTATPGFNPYAK